MAGLAAELGGGGGGGGAQPFLTVQLLFFAREIARVYTVINLCYDIQKSRRPLDGGPPSHASK